MVENNSYYEKNLAEQSLRNMFNILKYVSTQFIILITVVNMGYGQTNDTTQKTFNFASDILTHGEYVAYQYNVPDPNEELMVIMIKM